MAASSKQSNLPLPDVGMPPCAVLCRSTRRKASSIAHFVKPMAESVGIKWFAVLASPGTSSARTAWRRGSAQLRDAVGSPVASRSCFDGHAAAITQMLTPDLTTSARRCAVYRSRAKARRAREPIGCLASKAAISFGPTVEAGRPEFRTAHAYVGSSTRNPTLMAWRTSPRSVTRKLVRARLAYLLR